MNINQNNLLEKYYNTAHNLNLTPNVKRLEFRMKQLFNHININDKRVLDIGGGNGLYSFFLYSCGAREVICLEPEIEGSRNTMNNTFKIFQEKLNVNNVKLFKQTFQEYIGENKFDIILLHNSVNHLEEEACKYLHKDQNAKEKYKLIFQKLNSLINSNGVLILSDCTRYNFWDMIGLKNPFNPSINWEIHQSPKTWITLLESTGFHYKNLRWSSFYRLGSFGRLILANGFASFFLGSHFNLYMEKW